jgi:hypothetical protein
MPGNYQAVRLPKYWDFGTQSLASPGPQNGANSYRDWISGANGCANLAVGDSLQTETGNKVNPTLQGAEPNVCSTIVNNSSNVATHGDCLTSSGTVGVDIAAAFYACGTGCTGQSRVAVRLMGSFTVTKIYPDNDGGPSPRWDKSQIVGIFKPQQSSGGAGGGHTTFTKLVLAK